MKAFLKDEVSNGTIFVGVTTRSINADPYGVTDELESSGINLKIVYSEETFVFLTKKGDPSFSVTNKIAHDRGIAYTGRQIIRFAQGMTIMLCFYHAY